MESRGTAWSSRSHVVWALAAIALALVASISIVSRAEARFDLDFSVEPKRSTATPPRDAPAHRPHRTDTAGTADTERKRNLAQVRNAAGEPVSIEDATCEANMAIAAKQGLLLPDGWELHCVGPGLDWSGGSHWGVTCRYDECPEGAGPYVSISSPTYYVVAQELCHANFGDDEQMADQCAAEHGASLDTSPYV